MILSNILLDIDDKWSVKEKVRYIYCQMCKQIKYDDRFLYSANPKVLEEIYYKCVSIYEYISPEVVCNTANKLFSQLLDRENIKNRIIYKKNKTNKIININDVACLFYDEDGNEYYTSIIGDIENCRFGLKTAFFGINKNEYKDAQNVCRIPEEELFEIDKKTGLIKQDYSDIVFRLLKDEVKNTNNFKKFLETQNIDTSGLSRTQILEYKMKFLNEYIKFRDKTAGTSEMKKFYIKLFGESVLDKFEAKNFKTFDYIKQDGENISVLLLIAINIDTDPTFFYYSDELRSYVAIRKAELKEMLKGYKCSKEGKDIINISRHISSHSKVDENVVK